MPWHARLTLDYTRDGERTVARHAHEGPLRVLQTLYPEGDGIAHNVLVHPPSGIVGGDTLDIAVHAQPQAHAFITTPGASRFYRSDGEAAVQRTRIRVEAGARVEWLPLEAIAYSGCIAENHVLIDLAPGAELIGWDVVALGLPAAQQPFVRGSFLQHLELTGKWIERGRMEAGDAALMDGPVGLASRRCIGTCFFASGEAITPQRRDELLGLANDVVSQGGGALIAGATAPGPHVVAVRVLCDQVEPAMQLLKRVHAAWRPAVWQLRGEASRVWAL